MKCRQNQEFSKMWTCCHRWPRSKCCCCWKGERRWARLTENGGVLLQKAGKCKGELQLVWTISLLSYFIREVNSLGTFYLCPDQHVFRCWLWRRGKGEGAKENEMKDLTAKAIAGEEIKPVAWKSKEGVGERSMGGGRIKERRRVKSGDKDERTSPSTWLMYWQKSLYKQWLKCLQNLCWVLVFLLWPQHWIGGWRLICFCD